MLKQINHRLKIIFIGLGFVLNTASILIYQQSGKSYYWTSLYIWFLAVAISFFPFLLDKLKLKDFKIDKKTLIIVFLLLISSFLPRIYKLSTVPIPHGDEIRDTGVVPGEIIAGNKRDFWEYTGSIGNLFYLVATLPHFMFTDPILKVRFLTAVVGVAYTVLLYFFSKRFFNEKVAILASFFIAFYHVSLQFSRTELLNNLDMLWAPSIVWFLLLAIKKNQYSAFLLGLMCGFSLHFFTGIRSVIIVSISFYLVHQFFKRKLKYYFKNLAFLVSGFFIGLGPTLVTALSHPASFKAKGAGDFFTKTPLVLWSQDEVLLLLDRYLNSLGAYIYNPIDFHYRWGGPFLILPMSLFFLVGVLYLLMNIKQAKYKILILWLLVPPFFNSALTNGLTYTHRLLSTVPAMLIVAALGVQVFFRLMPKKFKIAFIAIAVIFFGYQNLKLYFIDHVWRNTVDYHTRLSTQAGYYIRENNYQGKYIFLSSDNLTSESVPTLRYLAEDAEIEDVRPEDLSLDSLAKNKQNFIIIPEFKESEIDLIQSKLPGGYLDTYPKDEETFFIYHISW